MFEAFHAESWYRDYDFSEHKFHKLYEQFMTEWNYKLVLAHDDHSAVGYMGGMISEHFFGDDLFAMDLGLYLKPEYRGEGFHAKKLIEAFYDWATRAGAKEIIVGVTAGIDDQRTIKFYQALGFDHQASAMRKRCIA